MKIQPYMRHVEPEYNGWYWTDTGKCVQIESINGNRIWYLLNGTIVGPAFKTELICEARGFRLTTGAKLLDDKGRTVIVVPVVGTDFWVALTDKTDPNQELRYFFADGQAINESEPSLQVPGSEVAACVTCKHCSRVWSVADLDESEVSTFDNFCPSPKCSGHVQNPYLTKTINFGDSVATLTLPHYAVYKDAPLADFKNVPILMLFVHRQRWWLKTLDHHARCIHSKEVATMADTTKVQPFSTTFTFEPLEKING